MPDNNITIIGPSIGPDYYQTTVFAPGELRVALEPSQLFYNAFDSGLDTTNVWTAVAGGGGVAPTNQSGQSNIGTGTTANGFSYLNSITTFQPVPPGWLEYASAINLPSPYVANTYFWIGPGNHATTPTAAAALTDGAGFEVAIGGKMFAVCWSGGARNQIADLSSSGSNKQPLDGNVHIYYIYYRGDNIWWAIDSRDNIVASIPNGSLGPVVNTLPYLLMAVAGTVAPASSAVLIDNLSYVADTTSRAAQLSDATFPWRKTTVDASGNLQTKLIAATSTLTSVASSATTVSLLALNGARKGLYVFNESTAILYIAYAATASLTAYTTQIPANSLFEMPLPAYTGAISGIWASANGNARITELT